MLTTVPFQGTYYMQLIYFLREAQLNILYKLLIILLVLLCYHLFAHELLIISLINYKKWNIIAHLTLPKIFSYFS